MKLLALDPSSSVIGYAIFEDRNLKEMGRITPDRERSAALSRVRSIRRQLLELIIEQSPDAIVVEGMIERQYTRGNYATALPLCGWAQGVIYGTCLSYAANQDGRCLVFVVDTQEWTRGSPKKERPILTAAQFPSYDPKTDPGIDIADAIMLACWWLDRQEKSKKYTDFP